MVWIALAYLVHLQKALQPHQVMLTCWLQQAELVAI